MTSSDSAPKRSRLRAFVARVPWKRVCLGAAAVGVLSLVVTLRRVGDVKRLASALEDETGAVVEASSLRWEPSSGVLGDFFTGRSLLYLARVAAAEPRDVWRARVRLGPFGLMTIAQAVDITDTPLGDDHALVVRGHFAAFATRAYDQEQAVTLLDLDGEGMQNECDGLVECMQASITNLQEFGTRAGVGRVDITLDRAAHAVGLELEGDGDSSRSLVIQAALETGIERYRVPLSMGEVTDAIAGVSRQPGRHLPKRFIHWAVDTVRSIPWIGPAPIAWLEEHAFAARDSLRQAGYAVRGVKKGTEVDNADAPVAVKPPRVVPPSELVDKLDDGSFPPPAFRPILNDAEPGEGVWVDASPAWLPRITEGAPSAFAKSFVRPDAERPDVKVLLVSIDMRQLDLAMEAGAEDPKPLAGAHGSGRIPRDPKVFPRVRATFNGAFKTEHGFYGMMVDKRVLLPPQPRAASLAVLSDGRVAMGFWPSAKDLESLPVTGCEPAMGHLCDQPLSVSSFRQNLDPLVDGDLVNPTKRFQWGYTLPGTSVQTERSAVCVHASGHLIYGWGDDLNGTTLAKALRAAGCRHAMHLDMNPHHTGFAFTNVESVKPRKLKAELLSPTMTIQPDRYVNGSPKDFFYLLVRSGLPPAPEGFAWSKAPGPQPSPTFVPAVWDAKLDGLLLGDLNLARLDITSLDGDRTEWRVRAGTKELASGTGVEPARDLDDGAHARSLASIRIGVLAEDRAFGLITGGHITRPRQREIEDSAWLIAEPGESLRIIDDPTTLRDADAVELLRVLHGGKLVDVKKFHAGAKLVIGITKERRVVAVRDPQGDLQLMAKALQLLGCDEAVLADRGIGASAKLTHRAGDDEGEGRLVALARTELPRAFRFKTAEPPAKGK